MSDSQPLKPANVHNIVAINQGKKPLTMATPIAKPLSPSEVAGLVADGAVVVDCRSSAEYGAGHIKTAINIQLSSAEFEQRAGWVTPENAPLILVANSSADAQRAIYNMAFVALDVQVLGFLSGGMTAWMGAGQPIDTVPQIDVHTLHHQLNTNGLHVVDARDDDEWNAGHIAQAHFMPFTHMADQTTFDSKLPTLGVPLEAKVAVVCATGKRSSTAVGLMRRHGYQTLYNVTGGMVAWGDARLPMIDGAGNACAI